MTQEIKGQDWNKEVVTSKPEANGGPSDAKRTEFYEKRLDFKSGDTFDSVVGDLTTKGYKTMEDLVDSELAHEIVAGDTLFPILKDFFLKKFAPAMSPDQAEKEAYLSLAFVMKNNPGVNVDDLKVKGGVRIDKGYLTVKAPDGSLTITNAALRPVQALPVTPGVVQDPKAPVPNIIGRTVDPTPGLTPIDPAPTQPTLPPEVPVQPVQPPVSPTPAPVAPAQPKLSDVTPAMKVLTEEDISNKYSGSGQYINTEGHEYIGIFEKGVMISGMIKYVAGFQKMGTFDAVTGNLTNGVVTYPNNGVSTGAFDATTRRLLNGTYVNGSLTVSGLFANTEDNELIDGVRVVDGKTEYVFPESKFTELEAKVAALKPYPATNVAPYFISGSSVKFKDGWTEFTSTQLLTVENPEKAKQLADKLNERRIPGATNAPAIIPENVIE